MVDTDNDFDLDNVNAGDSKDKIDLGDVCSGGVYSNDDGAVDIMLVGLILMVVKMLTMVMELENLIVVMT